MSRFTKILSEAFICLFLVTFSLSAFAMENSDDQWNFQLATYGWLSGQEGTIKAQGRRIAPLYSTILSDYEIGKKHYIG